MRRVRIARKITRGANISPLKLQLARELRSNMTNGERILWRELRRNGLAGLHFRRQQPIAGFIVDFYCNPAAVAVEVDGGFHSERKDYDAARDAELARRNIRVLRFTNEQIHSHLDEVLTSVLAACSLPPSTSGEGG